VTPAAICQSNEPPGIGDLPIPEPFGQVEEGEVDVRPATDTTASTAAAGVAPRYPSELEHDVVSGGNLRYHVRPIRADDGPRLVAFHSHLLPRSVFLRFFTFHPELSSKEVEHFTGVDYVNRLALVAEIDDHLIAVGRYDSAPGATEAEVAFVVSDEFQHHGIGALLLDELVQAARARGITAFRAETLCENHAMLDVFRHAGFPVTSTVEYGTVTLRFPIEPTDAYEVALADRQTSRLWRGDCPATPEAGKR
jgi:GNAT superfamily N-acetyltransferase